MTIKTEPFLSGKWGWDEGESGWKEGVDENFLKFSYLFNGNVDGFVASLPVSPTNGTAYYLSSDMSLNARVDGVWYKTLVPKGFVITEKSTGDKYEFSGSAFVKTLNAADRTKFDAIATGATANSSDATLLNRANHTGAQAIATVTGLQPALDLKAPLASPILTGVPEAPTPSTADNTTKIATTAFVTTALQALYPVGTIYSNISVSTNPATLFGFGTWVAITGRVVVGLDSGDASFDTVGETGGSKDAIVVSHTHTATVTDSGHTHSINGTALSFGAEGSIAGTNTANSTTGISIASATTGITVANSTTGSSGTNANLQPYVVAYVWKRTA